jgi:T4 RnlA family RNA ligase
MDKYPKYTFLFELVSPRNKIVLSYDTTELRLLQVRVTETGEYLPADLVAHFAKEMEVKSAEVLDHTLDELIELRETLENVEGWVIKFTDGQFIKLKTEWYIAAHGLMDDLSQEHKIIKMIMDETIDDVLGELENGSEEKTRIEEIAELIEGYYNHRVQKANDMRNEYFGKYNEDRKAFAIEYNKVQDFGVVMKTLNEEPTAIEKGIKERIIQENLHLEKARKLIDELKDKR